MKYLIFTLLTLLLSANSFAAKECMEQMATINPKKISLVESKETGENLLKNRGFGDQESEVRTMNLMMVEGSLPNKEATRVLGQSRFQYELLLPKSKAMLGDNDFLVFVRDKKTKEAKSGLNFSARISMANMNMGSFVQKVTEILPGKYQFRAHFSMIGLWAVTLVSAEDENIFNFEVEKR